MFVFLYVNLLMWFYRNSFSFVCFATKSYIGVKQIHITSLLTIFDTRCSFVIFNCSILQSSTFVCISDCPALSRIIINKTGKQFGSLFLFISSPFVAGQGSARTSESTSLGILRCWAVSMLFSQPAGRLWSQRHVSYRNKVSASMNSLIYRVNISELI